MARKGSTTRKTKSKKADKKTVTTAPKPAGNHETTEEPQESSTSVMAKNDQLPQDPRRSSRAGNKKRYCEEDNSDVDEGEDFDETLILTNTRREALGKRRKTTGNNATPMEKPPAKKVATRTPLRSIQENTDPLASPVSSIKKITSSRWEATTEDWRVHSVLDY
jgi:hypothetical protein